MGVTASAVLAPLALVLYQSFLTLPFFASSAQVGLDAYHLVFADQDFGIAFGTTLLLGGSMILIAVPLGAVLAFLMVRTDVPGRPWLEPLILLLIFLPAVVLAFGYVAALGPVGILTTAFKQWTGVVPWNLYSFPFLVAIAGTHSRAACVSLCCGGFARSQQRRRGSGLQRRRETLASSPRREPADGDAGNPVCRRAGFPPRF